MLILFRPPEHFQLHNIAGKPVVFEWRMYPGHTTAQLLFEIQTMLGSDNTHPYNFKGRIIFVSIYNDMDWDQQCNEDVRKHNSACV